MNSKFKLAALLAAAVSFGHAPAFAAGKDYVFETVTTEMKKGDDVIVSVRLVHKPSGKPVDGAVIVRIRIDMAPDGMADMVSPVTPVPTSEPGVYAFKTDLPMAGRYQLSLAAKVQGEPETVIGRVIVKASR